jgi:hypothetical protein
MNQWALAIVWGRTGKKCFSPKLSHLGEVQIGLIGNNTSTAQQGVFFKLRTHDHARSFGVPELLLVSGIANET